MRRVRYSVAVSLDGFIAGPKGEADWIIMDPEIDFQAMFEQFDTFLLAAHVRADGTRKKRRNARRENLRLLANVAAGGLSGGDDRRRGRGRDSGCATRGAGKGHLAVRWRFTISHSPRRRAGRYS